MSDSNFCPCGSELLLSECCLPVIEGREKATSAERLLRARYTAFTRGEIDFILATHHSRTRHELKRDEIEDWSKNSEWLGLKIIQVDPREKAVEEPGGVDHEKETLVFVAYYKDRRDAPGDPKTHEHWEKSFFEKENGDWRFLDAQRIQTGTVRRTEPKMGRNDPCSCGSGKKFKKCCIMNFQKI